MKSLIIKAILLVLTFIGLSQYMLYLTTGKNPLDSFKLPSFSFSAPELPGSKQTVYKWVDENGVTQYSAEPPVTISAQTIELDPNTNVILSTKIPEEEDEKATTPATEPVLPQGSVYSPETIKRVMDDAKNVQNLLNERAEIQDKALNDL